MKFYRVTMPDGKCYAISGDGQKQVARRLGISPENVALGVDLLHTPDISQYSGGTLTGTQRKILLAVADLTGQPITLNDIGQRLGVSGSTIKEYFADTSRVAHKFVNGEYLSWEPGQGRTVRLTEQGQKAIQGWGLHSYPDQPARLVMIRPEFDIC